jgi:hypothetical protein
MAEMTNNYKWWDMADKAAQAASLFSVITKIRFNDRERMSMNDDCMTIYGNYNVFPRYGSNSVGGMSASTKNRMPRNREKFNVASSCVDTIGAKISQMKPVITFLTEGGSYSQQRLGKNLGQFMRGLFMQKDIYGKHQQMFQDGNILDIGALHHYREDDCIYTERVMAFDLCVEDIDAMYGEPRRLYKTKVMPKATAMKAWPKFKGAIAGSKSGIDYGSLVNTEDQVLVVEAWHLPSYEGGDDGVHVIAVDQTVVFSEKWKRCRFPFTFHRWSYSGAGFWGQSLCERIMPNQLSINRMLAIKQQSFHLGSTYKVAVELGSKVVKDHINNQVGSIIYYQGTRPEWIAPKVIDPQYQQHIDWLVQACYQESGISELAAKAEKPAGLDSRVAIREYNDLQSERFILAAQKYESSFKVTASHYLDLCQDMADEGIALEVVAKDRSFLKKIKWADVKVLKDGYMMQMFPTSILPHTPAGQLAQIQDLVEGQVMPQEYALDMLGWPDLKSYTDYATSAIENIKRTIEKLLEGEWTAPEPFQDLQMGIKMMQMAYLYHKDEGTDPATLDQFVEWMRTAEAMLSTSQQATMTNQANLSAAAQGAQAAPPQSAVAPQPAPPAQ